MIVKTKTKIFVVDFKKKTRKKTITRSNKFEVADTQEPEVHSYCGACELCDGYKVVCRSGKCGTCEQCLQFQEEYW